MKNIIEGTKLAFQRYEEMLLAKGVKPQNQVDTDPTSLEHLLWMCQTSIKKLENDLACPIDKYSRWLGYVQGILVSKKLTTVEKERNVTRSWFSEAQ